ncbi:MAG: AAA family ATPase, partial [Myxococcota bacterium]
MNADIVGYGERMARDEGATVAAVRAARARAEELSARHRGRLVDFTGDNFLAEFGSAVEAVRFAVAFQASGGDPDAVCFRMGVHLGDVREEDGRLYGTGINVAARLQTLAEPRGVCASEAVVEQLAGKLDLGFEDAGEHVLKGIPRPVHVFRHPRRSPTGAGSPGMTRPRARGVRARDPYVGRENVLERLEAALDDAFAGRGALVWLSGEPGIGKTRTAEELVARAERRGAEVLWGRSLEGEGAPPLWPWMQILGAATRARDAERLLRDLSGDAPHVAKVVPEVRERLPDMEEPPRLEPAEHQSLFFGSVGRFLARAAERNPVVVVLEDLHAADESSLKLLRMVAAALWGTRVMLLGTTRDAPLQTRLVLEETWADVRRLPHSVGSIRLEGLEAKEVRELVRVWSSRAVSPAEVAALATRTDGNPLFVRELVQLMGSERKAGAGVPPDVQAVVRELAGRLSEATRDVLAAAAVVGRESSVSVLERALGLGEETLLDALEECEGVGLASEQDGRLRFAHALFQEALYDAIPRRRRTQLHGRVGLAI